MQEMQQTLCYIPQTLGQCMTPFITEMQFNKYFTAPLIKYYQTGHILTRKSKSESFISHIYIREVCMLYQEIYFYSFLHDVRHYHVLRWGNVQKT
jgi:hypothetical protein